MTTQHHTRHAQRSSALTLAGLVLAALLAVGDTMTVVPQLGDGDPLVVFVLACAVLTAAAVPFAWRGSARGRHTVVVTRVLSALTGLPAFFVTGVPAVGVMMAAVGIVLALIVAALVYSGSRQES